MDMLYLLVRRNSIRSNLTVLQMLLRRNTRQSCTRLRGLADRRRAGVVINSW